MIIAQDYITDGVRLRAQELATLELGPETDLELRSKLTAEISAERFTRVDRAMIAEASEGLLDLRPEAGQLRADFDRSLRIGRLQTLSRYGLAKEAEPGMWSLSEKLEPTLRELGERGDIVKAINRALTARGQGRSLESYSLHGEEPAAPIIGRVIDKRLTDELGERLGLVIDGVDGRVHHVALGAPAMAAAGEEATIGSIVEIAPAPTGPRPADRNIARIAGDSGVYRPSTHRAMAEAGGVRVPGGDYDAYVESHVRRLEALRRAGIVERIDADHWRIPEDFETRAENYDAQRRGRMTLRLLSNLDLEAQIDADGATWLDRELVSPNRTPLVRAGFGAEVDGAMQRRRQALVDKGHAWRTPDGGQRAPKDLIARLERQEIERVGKSLAAAKHAPFKMKGEGERVSGVFTGDRPISSRENMRSIENAYEFTLVPWRPVMDDRLGRQISGVARTSGVSWDLRAHAASGLECEWHTRYCGDERQAFRGATRQSSRHYRRASAGGRHNSFVSVARLLAHLAIHVCDEDRRGTERYDPARANCRRHSIFRIASNPLPFGANIEGPEPSQAHRLAANERRADFLQGLVQKRLSFGSSEPWTAIIDCSA